jgi:hypothetical protein
VKNKKQMTVLGQVRKKPLSVQSQPQLRLVVRGSHQHYLVVVMTKKNQRQNKLRLHL